MLPAEAGHRWRFDMSRIPKRKSAARSLIDRNNRYPLEDAIGIIKKYGSDMSKFDETVEVAINLGVDPKQSDQTVRGAVVLPHGTGKTVRVLVFAKGEKEAEARDAGADFVGAEELIEKIQGGWYEFDTAIAIPPMMGQVGKLGKYLGRRGLMPNPKTGTVTMDVTRAVEEAKKGKVEFRVEKKGAIVHAPIGKLSFTEEQLTENAQALIEAIVRAKPSSSKGTYMKKITLSSTMSPGVRVDPATATASK
jgi:large subunit ribosomal protein L1